MAQKKVVSKTSFVDPNKKGTTAASGTSRIHRGTVEAQWTCTSCGTSGIGGFTKVCPNCGNPRDSDETYQPPNNLEAPDFASKEELQEAGVDEQHSSDQICRFCGYYNKPGTSKCSHCGSNLNDVARTTRICDTCGFESNLQRCPSCGYTTRPKKQPQEMKRDDDSPFQETESLLSRFTGLWWIPTIVALIGLMAFFFWPRQTTVRVSDQWWVYTVSLQEYQYNSHEGWTLPSGADRTGDEQRIHHYESVLDHYENQCHMESQLDGYETVTDYESVCESVYDYTETTCYDDGSCDYDDVYTTECHDEPVTREEPVYKDVQVCEDVPVYRDDPVYQTWYTYNIWEWMSISPSIATEHNFDPYWPSGYTIDDKHRESGRFEEYFVVLISIEEDKEFNISPTSLEEFLKYQTTSEWIVTYSGNMVTEIEASSP